MSVKASAWAWEQREKHPSLTDKEFIVLLYLADKSGDNGLSWYSRGRIQAHCKIKNIRTVSNIFSSLERKSLISRYKRFTQSGDQTSNATIVLFEGRDLDIPSDIINEKHRYKTKNKGVTAQLPPRHCTVTTSSLCSDPKRNRNVSGSSSKPEPAQDEGREDIFNYESVLAWLLSTFSEKYNLTSTDNIFIEESLDEYHTSAQRPAKSRALSWVEQALKNRISVQRRSLEVSVARDRCNNASVENLNIKTSNLKNKSKLLERQKMTTQEQLTDISWQNDDIYESFS